MIPLVPFVGAGRLLTYRLSALDAETLGDSGLLPDRAVRRRGAPPHLPPFGAGRRNAW